MSGAALSDALAAVADDLAAAERAHLSIVAAVTAGDRRGVISATRDVPARLREPLRVALALWWSQAGLGGFTPEQVAARLAHRLAEVALAATPAGAAGSLRWLPMLGREEAAGYAATCVEALRDRGGRWLERFAASLVASANRNAAVAWRLVSALVDAGLIEPPAHPNYRSDVLWAFRWEDLPDLVAADPKLAGRLRELFRTPGVGLGLGRRAHRPGRPQPGDAPRASAYQDAAWSGLLAAWGSDDADRRPSLLDDCLTALSGSLPERDAPGFIEIHRRLEPTIEEAAERQGRYLTLLLSPVTGTVALARTQLRRLLDEGRLDGDGLAEVTTDVLLRREKVVVREHLRLLTDAVAAGALDPGACADAVAPALDPERMDIAILVARLLRRCVRSTPHLRERLAQDVTAAVPHPSPDLREALGPLAVAPQAEASPSGKRAAPAASLPVDLPGPGLLEPLRDLAGLTALLEEMHTTGATALDVERVIDAIARIRPERPVAQDLVRALVARPRGVPVLLDVLRSWAGWKTPDAPSVVFRTGGSLDRSDVPEGAEVTEHRQMVRPHVFEGDLETDAHEVVSYVWRLAVPAWTPRHLVSSRMQELRRAHLRRPPAPLLATPTHDDGSLTVDVFLARLHERAATGLGAEPHDLGAALLRLRPEERAALMDSGHLRPETAERLAVVGTPFEWRYGAVAVSPRWWPGRDDACALWQAANSPRGAPDDPVRAWLDTEQLGRMWWDLTTGSGRADTTVETAVGLWALTLPSHPDVLGAHLQHLVAWAIDNKYADVSGVMALVGTSRARWGPPAAHAVVVGGTTMSARARAAAAEALALAARRGVVSAPVLAEALAAVLDPAAAPLTTDGYGRGMRAKVNRVAGTLADASGIDDGTGRLVLDAVASVLDPLSGLRGGVAFVELAAQLAERLRVRVDLPPALAAIAAGRSASRTAQEARRLAAAGRP